MLYILTASFRSESLTVRLSNMSLYMRSIFTVESKTLELNTQDIPIYIKYVVNTIITQSSHL